MPRNNGQAVLRGTVSLTELAGVFRGSHFMNRMIITVDPRSLSPGDLLPRQTDVYN
jgi:hypothetical protein